MAESKKIIFGTEETIRTVTKTHADLSHALAEASDVVINTSAITEVDIAFVQLLEAARKTAGAEEKKLSMEVPASGPLLEVLQRGGFLETQNDVSFWLSE